MNKVILNEEQIYNIFENVVRKAVQKPSVNETRNHNIAAQRLCNAKNYLSQALMELRDAEAHDANSCNVAKIIKHIEVARDLIKW